MDNRVFVILFLTIAQQIYSQQINGYCSADDIGCNLGIDESLNELDQEDPKLIEAIRTKYLTPPSTKEYEFDYSIRSRRDGEDQYPHIQGQYLQPPLIDKYGYSLGWLLKLKTLTLCIPIESSIDPNGMDSSLKPVPMTDIWYLTAFTLSSNTIGPVCLSSPIPKFSPNWLKVDEKRGHFPIVSRRR